MQGDTHEQEKKNLFLPSHGTIIGNASEVGVSRALKADLTSMGISLLREIKPQWFLHSAASGSHLPVTSSYMQVSYSDKMIFMNMSCNRPKQAVTK